MFQNWGFLITEMGVLLLLAALLGLVAGWIVWGRKTVAEADADEIDGLKAELETCREAGADQAARIATLEDQLAGAKAEAATDSDFETVASEQAESVKPATLNAARDGQPDDLKQIRGVGPKLETLVNELGFYHFDQIAAWTPAEVAWVDANLTGFKGRVSRDGWVEQARVLAAGGTTVFSEKVKKGEVY